MRPVDRRCVIKTLRAIKRLLTELPQPARAFYWSFISIFLGTFLLGVITRVNWAAIGVSIAGLFLFLFGLHVFRDVNGTASTWSRVYRESRGIRPEGFTFADVPTIKGMGFMCMLLGVFFAVGGIGFSLS